ncbi:MAG: glycerol-3-phosphate dehydrogenase [Planctomycetes bacterium]|jgi:glycerol-3-phosphate dehydrogenase (NAD(P)+)|nr:glycerol-3-phosphate dehydrogenase [Planctomycetota bacterium]MDP6424953.1 NAD(P)H-dependent glycerol-3-phosphate dehydrogenase [Planctomycetota bacterium]
MSGSPCITVLGNGGFGTALSMVQHWNGHDVRLWGHDAEYTATIAATRENPRYLTGVSVPEGIDVSSDAPRLLAGADAVLLVVPTQHVRSVLDVIGAEIPDDCPVVVCCKGMEEVTGLVPSAICQRMLPGRPVYVLTGPCHAEELAREQPASLVLAGPGAGLPGLQGMLSGPTFRVYRSEDALGAALCAAVKNIIAIAAGICDGLGLGDNAKAALLTRGLAEMTRFGESLGAKRETFYGLAGIGDLITTAVSPHGRNRALGERIGHGETLQQILASTCKVVEGVWTCRAVLTQAETLGVRMPVAEEVSRVLFEDRAPKEAVRALMGRDLCEE